MNLTEDQRAKLRDETSRGTLAKAVFDNAVFVDAITRIRAKYIAAWQTVPIDNKDAQHFVRIMLACHDSIVSEMYETMRTGQMAEFSLEQSPFRTGSRRRRKDAEKDD